VDVRDIAEAAAIALTAGGHEGQTYNLVGPQLWTGTGAAEAWGRALGKSIAYAGDDLDAWEAQSLQYLPPWLVFDIRLMYAFFQKSGLKATGADRLPDKTPRARPGASRTSQRKPPTPGGHK
jgi:uncharacterized protein YbjT (DUF2867 family)